MADRTSATASDARGALPAWSHAEKFALGLVLLLVGLTFVQVAGFGFVNWDDRDLVLQNPLIVRPGSVPLLHHLTTPESGYPIPVTILSYRIEHALAGFDHPWLQHLVNLFFHLGSVALVFGIARIVGASVAGAALASCIAGLHPAVGEPVSWLTGRKDVLALFFMLATLRLALSDGRGGRLRLVRSAAFVLALGSKPVAVALVPMLVVLAFARQAPAQPWPRRLTTAIKQNAFEIAVALVFVPVAYFSHRAFGGLRDGEHVATSLRSAWYGLGAHLAMVAGLEPPCVQHLVELPPRFTARFDLLPIAVAAASGVLLRQLRKPARTVASLALVWAALAYLPSAGLIPMRRFIADSYVYPVLPGIGIACGIALTDLLARAPSGLRLVRAASVPLVAVGFALLAAPSSGRFRNTASLWADAMERNPSSWQMCRNWAVAMVELGGPAKSLAATDTCIEHFGREHFEKNRAVALFDLGRSDEAALWMRQALARNPGDANVPPELLRRAQEAEPETR
jgi:hypothetical protein